MPPTERHPFYDMPYDELLTIVLRQFRRPLVAKGIDLTDAIAKAVAHAAGTRAAPDENALRVRIALAELVAESETVLAAWDLTFAQALATAMDALHGWQTTAEFLEIANEKSNAELRIAAGSALVMALGDPRYKAHLITIVEHDPADLDAIIARRVLCFAAKIAPNDKDWLEKVMRNK